MINVFLKKNDENLSVGFLGVKLFESDDKQFICCHPTSFLPLKAFGPSRRIGHKSIKEYFYRAKEDFSHPLEMTK